MLAAMAISAGAGCAGQVWLVHRASAAAAAAGGQHVAWAPDGSRVAFAGEGGVSVYSLGAQTMDELPIGDPMGISFDETGVLHVLDHCGVVHRYKPGTVHGDRTSVVVPLRPSGTLRVVLAGNALLVIEHVVEPTSFGALTESRLGILGRSRARWLHEYSVAFPKGWVVPNGCGAMTLGAEHSRRATWMTIELHAPPQFRAYHRLAEVDPGSGELRYVAKILVDQRYLHFEWAPNGEEGVFGGEAGVPTRFDSSSKTLTPIDTEARGFFVTYSPGGGHLFVGGDLIGLDGTHVAHLEQADQIRVESGALVKKAAKLIKELEDEGLLFLLPLTGRRIRRRDVPR